MGCCPSFKDDERTLIDFDSARYNRLDQSGKDFVREVFEKYLPVQVSDLSSGNGQEKYGVDQIVRFAGSDLCYIDPEVRDTQDWGPHKAWPYGNVRILARKKKYDKNLTLPVFHVTISKSRTAFWITNSKHLESRYATEVTTYRGTDFGYEVPRWKCVLVMINDIDPLKEWFKELTDGTDSD